MELSEITQKAGRHKRRRRVGRGRGSGMGKTSTRGHKGSWARAGGGPRPMTEGGQMSITRRIPKRGFNNAQFRTLWSIVNVGDLQDRFEDAAHVTAESLVEAGLIRNRKRPLKVLANGELTRKLTVEAQQFSAAAAEKITGAGGEVRVVV